MSVLRPLRGGCQCGRNRYIISVPEEGTQHAQVLFNTDEAHRIPLGTPLAAYIRVPLTWYHSTTFAFFDDETHTSIRRVYEHPAERSSKRQFCGYCGTPLSFWSEEPASEADFIHLTLGSLVQEDLQDLEDMGLIPDEPTDDNNEGESNEAEDASVSPPNKDIALRQSFGVPWFDSLVEGTRLGKMRQSKGIKQSQDGSVNIEWEVVEFNDAEDDQDVEMTAAHPAASGI